MGIALRIDEVAPQPLDQQRIEAHVVRLKAAAVEFSWFESLVDELDDDRSLPAPALAEIARRFARRPVRNRKQAVEALMQEGLRLAHARAKAESAAKTRLW
jgi:hypothetical protein